MHSNLKKLLLATAALMPMKQAVAQGPEQNGLRLLPAAVENHNPMFGAAQNSIGLYANMGFANSELYPDIGRPAPFGMILLNYSQPTKIFRLNARQNFHIGHTIGMGEKYGEDWRDYTWFVIGLSLDAVFATWDKMYLGWGLGIVFKSGVDARQDSRLAASTKTFIGYNLTQDIGLELFTLHISNGNLTKINRAYNFFGVGAHVRF